MLNTLHWMQSGIGMRVKVRVLGSLVLIALVLLLQPVSAEERVEGSIVLGPAGGPGSVRDVVFAAEGLALRSGDTLRFSWSANNATGPEVQFSIFGHGATHRILLAQNGSHGSGTWPVPGSETYGAEWTNPSSGTVVIAYTFDAIRGSSDVLLVVIFAAFVVLAVAVAWGYYRVVQDVSKGEPKVTDETAEGPPTTDSDAPPHE